MAAGSHDFRSRLPFLAALTLASALSLAPTSAQAQAVEPPSELPPSSEVLFNLRPAPSGPWMMQLVNNGKAPVRINADARLVWLEVITAPEPVDPAKHKGGVKATGFAPGKIPLCRAPAEMRPSANDEERSIILKPGERYEEPIDPMLLCGASAQMTGLKPGAVIYPHFGHPDPAKKATTKPKKNEAPKLPEPPYVVESLRDPRDVLPLRNMHATPFVLGAPQATEAAAEAVQTPPKKDEPELIDERGPRLVLTSTALTDAASGSDVVVNVTITNRGKRGALVHLKSEDISFALKTPDGLQQCGLGNNLRAAARDFFETLAPGAKRSFSLRLRELCPVNAFARPGIYEATAKLSMLQQGDDYKLDAFVTEAQAEQPTRIRVRTGTSRYHLTPAAPVKPETAAPKATETDEDAKSTS